MGPKPYEDVDILETPRKRKQEHVAKGVGKGLELQQKWVHPTTMKPYM
jgi:hypothetical protein